MHLGELNEDKVEEVVEADMEQMSSFDMARCHERATRASQA